LVAGDETETAGGPGSAPKPFAVLRLRFERELAAAVDPAAPWPECLAVAIRAALRQAAADPAAARRLILPAAGRRNDDLGPFTEMVDGLAARLRGGAPVLPRPERTARNLVLRVARQTLLQLETRPEEPVTSIGPDLIVFALTPYVGLAEARRLGDHPIATP
jgi:hypothetical protein